MKVKWTETIQCPKCSDDVSNYDDWKGHSFTCDKCKKSCGWCICADIIQDDYDKNVVAS